MIIGGFKFLTWFLRTFTNFSGTALPGLLLERHFPKVLKKNLNQFEKVILVTGTNGKTTTTRMLCHLLKQNQIGYVSNSSGSNLIRGIASVIIEKSSFTGKIKDEVAIFEVEEASLPKLVKYVKPELIIVTNIFRDQLDAYGEIDKTYSYIKDAIISSENPKLILNYDDHRVASLGEHTTSKVEYIAFSEEYLPLIKFENKKDFHKLPKNITPHLISNITINPDLSTHFTVDNDPQTLKVSGLHNAFNAVAAQVALQMEFNPNLNLTLAEFEPVFGRGETIKIKNTHFYLLLGKNPAGLNLNLTLLNLIPEKQAVVFILNDKIADGKDVSWIWDCNFDLLKSTTTNNSTHYATAGTRKYDIALRLKYTDITPQEIFTTYKDLINFYTQKNYKSVYILATYTGMREFRAEAENFTQLKQMWKE